MTDITYTPDQYVKFKDGVDLSDCGEEPGTMYVFAMYSEINPEFCIIGEPWAEEGLCVGVDEIRPATEQEIAEYGVEYPQFFNSIEFEGKAND